MFWIFFPENSYHFRLRRKVRPFDNAMLGRQKEKKYDKMQCIVNQVFVICHKILRLSLFQIALPVFYDDSVLSVGSWWHWCQQSIKSCRENNLKKTSKESCYLQVSGRTSINHINVAAIFHQTLFFRFSFSGPSTL